MLPSPGRSLLLLAALLASSCGKEPAPPGKGAPGAPAPAPASAAPAGDPLEGFRWNPDDLLADPSEFVAQPGTGNSWLEGVVEGPDGKPLSGADVEVTALPYGEVPAHPLVHARAKAGPDGRFRVGPGPTPWTGIGVLHAEAPGFSRTSLVNRAMAAPGEPWAEPGVEARIRLRPGIPVKGEVRGEDGGPPDAPVTLWIVGRSQFSLVRETDAAGAFSFTAPEGPLSVTVMEGAHPMTAARLAVQPGVDNFVQVPVRRGRDVPLRVLDQETGKPIPGAVLRTYYGRSTVERTDGKGEFLLRKYWFTAFQARAPGYAARFNYIPEDVGTPRNPVMEVRLPRGFVARGRILDLDGRPLPGLRTHCFAKDVAGNWLDILGSRSGADGSFTMVGLPVPGHGREIRVFAGAPGFAFGASPPLPGAAGGLVDGVEIRVPRLVEVRGRVEDERGGSAPAAVEAQWEMTGGLADYVPRIPDRTLGRVLEDGTFRVFLPERNRFVLRITGDAIEDLLLEGTSPSHPGPGSPPSPGEPVVAKVRRGHTLRGLVTDAAGRPVGRGDVRIVPHPPAEGRPSRDGRLASDGTFEVGGLGPGLQDLWIVVHPDFLQESVPGVPVDGEPLRVTLRRAGGVRGKILPGGEVAAGTVAEVAVTALGPTSPLPGELSRRVPVGEAFRLGPLAPGPYSVAVVAGDRRFDLDRVVVDDGGACDLGEIVLSEPTGVVSGTVRVAGNPAAGVPLEILRLLPGGRFESVRRLQSGPDGSWRAGGLLGGPHRVVAHPRDHPLAQAEFDSRPGEPAVLDLDVPEGGRLVVRVLDAAGAPAEGARVLLQGPEGALLFWEAGNPGPGPHATGRDGVLRAVGVPAGPCRVVVDLPGKGSGEAEAVVAAGAEALLEVRLGGR